MSIGPSPLCVYCVHFHNRNQKGLTCDAFPQGIPLDILDNRHDHNRSFPGDNGITFEAKGKVNKDSLEMRETLNLPLPVTQKKQQ